MGFAPALPDDLGELVEALVDIHCARWQVRLRVHSKDTAQATLAQRELDRLEALRAELIAAVDSLVETSDLPAMPHG